MSAAQLTDAEGAALEAMIDRASLSTVLGALGVLCEVKASHIAYTWSGDAGTPLLVKNWQAAGVACTHAERAVQRYRL